MSLAKAIQPKNCWVIICLFVFTLGPHLAFSQVHNPLIDTANPDDPLFLQEGIDAKHLLKPESTGIMNVSQDPRIVDLQITMGNDEWTTNGPYGGGAFYAIAIAPGDSNIMYTGSNGIGMYKSTDAGASWFFIESLDVPYIYAIAIDPKNSDVVYVGSYEGIYKTIDGGATWQKKNNGLLDPQVRFGVIIDPDNSQVVYVGTRNHVFKTEDGGDNWESVLEDAEYVNILVFDPGNSNTIYAGDRNGVWKTVDSGANWSFSQNGLPQSPFIYGLAVDPSNPDIIYAGMRGLYRSDDGGENWSLIGLEDKYIYWGLRIDTSNHDNIFVGTGSDGVYKTVDGGNNWENISDGLPNVPVYDVKLNPQNSTTLFCATYRGGVFTSQNSGAKWSEMSVNTRHRIQDIDIATDNQGIMYAATIYGGIFKSVDMGNSWMQKNSGIERLYATFVIIDPSNSNTVYCHSGSDFYKSMNGGESWETINTGIESVYRISITISPSHPNVLFAGTSKGLFKTENGGDSWERIGFEDKWIGGPIAVHPRSADTLYVGIDGEDWGMYRTTNGGSDWELINEGLTSSSFSDIEIDPSNPDVVYTSAYMDGIFKSENKGENWQYTGLAGHDVMTLAVDPGNSNVIYSGCSDNDPITDGVYMSINGGRNWSSINTGLESKEIHTLAIDPNDNYHLFAGTSNFGVWDYTIQNFPPVVNIVQPEVSIFEYKTPVTFIGYADDQEESILPDSVLIWQSSLQGVLGRGDTLTVDSLATGQHTITFSGYDSFGAATQDSMVINILPDGVELVAILEAETDMTPIADGISRNGIEGMIFWLNGTLASKNMIHFPENRLYSFNIVAKGWEVQGWPLCNLTLDGNPVAKDIEISSDVYREFDVPAILQAGDYQVEFTFTNELYIQGEGDRKVALDKIFITAPILLNHDVAVEAIFSPEGNISPFAAMIPNVRIGNYGTNTETDIDLNCVISKIDVSPVQEVYRNSQNVATLTGFEQKEISFDSFTPPGEGEYEFLFYHSLAGDKNSDNDSLSTRVHTALFVDASQFADVADAGNGLGAAVGDYDLDGYLDIYHTKNGNNVLFHNNQNGTFGDRAPDEGLEGQAKNSRSAGWFDYNNDGRPDLVVNNVAGTLYRNDGGSFTDVTWISMIGIMPNGEGIGIGDYNSDGYLDFYVTRYSKSNLFYSNNGDGTFKQMAAQLGVMEADENGSSAQFWDFDMDGDQDLLVVNHTQDTHLYRNNGDSTFTQVAEQVGINHGGNAHHALIFDYNNDGLFDLYLINSKPHAPENLLYRNDGGTFTNVTESAGVGDAGDGYGGACGDFDNDGFVDFYLANADGANLLYHNNGDGTFTDIASAADVDDSYNGQGTVTADFDNDGDLDIYLVNNNQPNALFYNTGTNNNWLQIKAVGKLSNRDAMGAIIKVVANGQTMSRMVNGNPGFGSQSSLIASFGLGQATIVDSIIIHWPSGIVQDTTNVTVNQKIIIDEAILAHDIAANKILSPGLKATAGLPITPQMLIQSFGAADENNIEVVCVVDTSGTEVFRNVQNVDQLDNFQEKMVTFSEYIPLEKGDYHFIFYTNLADDQNRDNDSLSITIEVTGLPFFINVATALDLDDGNNAQGIAFGDYNNDGFQDIYVSNSGPNILYKNNGDGTFTDISEIAHVRDDGNSWGCIFADYDNDGYQDIYLSNTNRANILYHNNGNGAFSNVAAAAGVDKTGECWGLAFSDYNNDGYLDIYVAINDQTASKLYKNNQDGTFEDVTLQAGVGHTGYNAGVTFGDYDNDGDPDILVSNRLGPSVLCQNNGDGTFTDVGAQAGVSESGNAHGAVFGDYDNDGHLDLLVTTADPNDRQYLYHNNGDGTFTYVSVQAGLGKSGGIGHGVAFLDYDYDGYLDIFIADERNDVFYHNNGNGTFTEMSKEVGIDEDINGWGVAIGDCDADGDLDIYVANNGSNAYYQNQGTPNNWIIVKLVGTISNKDAIGARVKVVSESFSQIREINGGSGTGSQNSLAAAFGLGQDTTVDSLIIRWPSGIVQVAINLAAKEFYSIVEDSTLVSLEEPQSREISKTLPQSFDLRQNYPNPFNPETSISFQLPRNEKVEIVIYNQVGQVIRRLAGEEMRPGHHQVIWDAKNEGGEKVASGIYLCQMRAGSYQETIKMLLIR